MTAARRTLGWPVGLYVLSLSAVSLSFVVMSLLGLMQSSLASDDLLYLVGSIILIAAATARPVELRPHVKLSLRVAPQLMAAVLLSPAHALVAAGVGVLAGYLYHLYRGRHNLLDVMFNTAQAVLSTAAASVAFAWTESHLQSTLAEPAALLLAGESMHLSNSLLVAGAMSVSKQDTGLLKTFVRLLGNDPLQYAALLVSGILGALLAREAFWAVPLLLVPIALVERTLIKQREEAERERKLQVMVEVNRLKNDFIAGVTHDLRTPLMVIKGFGELLAEREDEFMDDERRAITSINANAGRLSELIEMLLQLSELDAGMVVLRRGPTDVSEVVGRVIDQVKYHAEQKGVAVHMTSGSGIPLLNLDQARLEQVVANLVGNAIKFTPTNGEVTVGMHLRDDALVLTVRDTGPGIPPDVLPHIFDRFYRANHPDAGRRQTGGLGLAICKSIVELHGGTISAESSVGSGTTMVVTLPRLSSAEGQQEGPEIRDRDLADILRPARPLPNAR